MDNSTTPPPSGSSTAMNGDKLSGQLVIKAQLGDDIRKMMIHNEDLTFNELVLMIERIFTGKISNSDELTIKYLDNDGDKITLLNDSDLTVALHFHKLLRLFVIVNGNEQINANSTDKNLDKEGNLIDTKTFHNELQELRNSVQTILDRLQLSTNELPTTTHEFDPHKHSQQQRSATSDSTRSNSNNNEHQTAPTVDTQHGESTDVNRNPRPSTFQHTQMPTPYFTPSGFNNDQQAKPNVFGPPPTNSAIPRYPPAITPISNTPPPSSVGQQPGGFYGQQQGLFQPRPSHPNFNTNNTFPPPQSPSSSSSATINPSFVQPPPPMASQQPYGAYPPQNSYYNPVQQYPKTS